MPPNHADALAEDYRPTHAEAADKGFEVFSTTTQQDVVDRHQPSQILVTGGPQAGH